VTAAHETGPVPRKSRRYPTVTVDTSRPEGGGRAAPGGAPAPARQWPLLAVLGIAAAGLLITAFDHFRFGAVVVGVGLVTGAVLRWVVRDVGMLAVRSRFTDVTTYGLLGLAIVILALRSMPDPKLKVPFLDEILHFTF
jgi:hypothetical protein